MDPERIEVKASEEIKIGEATIAHGASTDGSEAIRCTDDKGSSYADLASTGSVAYGSSGQCPQGEADDADAMRLFVEKLNQTQPGRYGEAKPREARSKAEDGVDIEVDDLFHKGTPLKIQVTRALPTAEYWRDWNTSQAKTVKRETSLNQVADDLFAAINKKARRGKPEIVLALIAPHTPAHALAPVISHFRQRYGGAIGALGWKSIWVVGPTLDTTSRLD